MKFWMKSHFWEKHYIEEEDVETHLELNKTNNVHTFRLERRIFQKHRDRKVTILVLFYEDFIHNFVETTYRMFEFMREGLGNAMPSPIVATTCAVKNHQSERAAHRKRLYYNPYHDQHGGVVKLGVVKEFCMLVEDYWYEEKWGPCEAALLQSYRGLDIYKNEQLRHISTCTNQA